MLKQVLYLSYDGMTDPLGQSQVLPYLAGLSKKGYQFTLVSFEKPEKLEKNKAVVEKICSDNAIDWQPLPYTKTPPVLSTLKDIVALRKKIKTLHQQKKFELVHCRSYITMLAGEWMKKKWNVKLVFDMRGFWADERVDGKLWNLNNPVFKLIYRYFKKKEKQFLSLADNTISLTTHAKQEIHSWTGITKQPVPIQIIPCCVDLELFNPEKIDTSETAALKAKLGIPDKAAVISYIGSVGTWYMLPEMLAFFKRWVIKNPNSVFLFITGDDPEMIKQEAEKAGIMEPALRIVKAARDEMPGFISLCDYSLFFIKPVYSKKASSPTKQGEIMAMGKPVICNSKVGDTDYVVNKYHSGELVNEFTDIEYDRVVNAVSKNFSNEEIRNGARQFFSLEEGIKRYDEVYKAVLKIQ